MRLIDADALLKDVLTAGIGKTIIEYSESDIGYMIRKRPTVDAAPMKHGRWVFVEQRFYMGGFINMLRCSLCKSPTDKEYNYCPNCGARMDGE